MSEKSSTAPQFTKAERDAMKERAKELKAEAAGKKKREDAEADQLAKIAELSDADRALAERIHAIVAEAAPELEPKLWYGMPGYARDGKVVVFFQPAEKFSSRYSTLGFNDGAALDDGEFWPVAFALASLSAATEKKIAELVKNAAR